MRRETQNVLLVLLGGALCKLTLTGVHTRYVKPSMGPWLLAAGLLILLLAVLAIGRDIAAARRGGTDEVADAHGHQHSGRSPWLLVLPVLAVFLIAPPALGADSVRRAEQIEPPRPVPATAFPALPAGRELPMTLSDFVTRSAYDASNALNSRTVRLTGFVAKQRSETYLARMVITCCAADAMPLRVRLLGGDVIDFRSDEWVTVTGVLRPGPASMQSSFAPDLRVSTIRRTTEPADPYEH